MGTRVMSGLAGVGLLVLVVGCSGDPRTDAAPGQAEGAGVGQEPTPSAVVVGDSAVGCMEIGAALEAVRAACGEVADSTISVEGSPQQAVRVDVGGDHAVAEVVDGAVWRIRIDAPDLLTSDGIGVGTPVSRLASLPGIRIAHGEGTYARSDAHCGKSFEVGGLSSRPGGWTADELRALPDSVRVVGILVVGRCPDPTGGTVHEYAYLDDEVEHLLDFLQHGAPLRRELLADSVTLYVAPEGGGESVTATREELRSHSAWRVGSYSLVPPGEYDHRTITPGLHWSCLSAALETRYPELARFPHVGTRLAPDEDAGCLQTWNVTFVFDGRPETPRLIAVVYDQWEW